MGERFEYVKRLPQKTINRVLDASPSAVGGGFLGGTVLGEALGPLGVIPGIAIGGVAGEIFDRKLANRYAKRQEQRMDAE